MPTQTYVVTCPSRFVEELRQELESPRTTLELQERLSASQQSRGLVGEAILYCNNVKTSQERFC
jgi:hypothetical protein